MLGVTPEATRRRRTPAWRAPAPARVRRVRDRLRDVYGVPLMAPHGHPIAELILTVLSQSTNDRNRDVAYLRLRGRLPSWEQVRDAPVAEVEEAIRPGGISKVKSLRIQAILRAITDDPRDPGDELSLDWLPRVPRSLRASTSSRCRASGARRPRACCCSHTACTTFRSTRTSRAWAGAWRCCARARRSRSCTTRCSRSPRPGEELELHVNLLRHGRRTCHARRPACTECALARMCPSRHLFV